MNTKYHEANGCGYDLDFLTSCSKWMFHILQEVDAENSIHVKACVPYVYLLNQRS